MFSHVILKHNYIFIILDPHLLVMFLNYTSKQNAILGDIFKGHKQFQLLAAMHSWKTTL